MLRRVSLCPEKEKRRPLTRPCPPPHQERQQQEGAWDVEKGSYPLVFAGGPTATSNPEPFADFYDYFAIGDGAEHGPAQH